MVHCMNQIIIRFHITDILARVQKREVTNFIHHVEKVNILIVGLKWGLEINVQTAEWPVSSKLGW